jgi:hypothetical protein
MLAITAVETASKECEEHWVTYEVQRRVLNFMSAHFSQVITIMIASFVLQSRAFPRTVLVSTVLTGRVLHL